MLRIRKIPSQMFVETEEDKSRMARWHCNSHCCPVVENSGQIIKGQMIKRIEIQVKKESIKEICCYFSNTFKSLGLDGLYSQQMVLRL